MSARHSGTGKFDGGRGEGGRPMDARDPAEGEFALVDVAVLFC